MIEPENLPQKKQFARPHRLPAFHTGIPALRKTP
jgi:hypothetical protein